MSSSTTMDASISHLPDEILANILSRRHSASDCVVSLWLCGDRTLNTRLSRGGCTSFVTSIYELIKWPRMLSQLKALRQVVIEAKAVREPIKWMSGELLKLPSHLEVLELNFTGSAELFYAFWNSLTTREVINFPQHNIGELFPQLQSLMVLSPETDRFMSLERTSSLPDTLTSLHLGVMLPLNTEFKRLPPNLTRLHLNSPYYRSLDVLPSTLKESSTCLGFQELGLFPSLTSLIYSYNVDDPHFMPALPRGITHLTTNFSHPFEFGSWPSNLTSLDCALLYVSELAQLPETLLCLNVGRLPDYTLQLKAMSRESTLALWPKNLTSLIFKAAMEVTGDELDTFPPTLTKLLKVRIVFKRSVSSVVSLSPAIKHLDFSTVYSSSRGSLLKLPPQLETLTAKWKQHESIPPTLQSLHLEATASLEYLCLPRNLTSLYIDRLSECTDPFRYLSRSLTSLSINHSPTLPPANFANLPKSLKKLSLLYYYAPFDVFMHLPTTIASAQFSIHSFDPSITPQIPLRWLLYLLESEMIGSKDVFLDILAHCPSDRPLTPKAERRLRQL